MRSTGNGIVLVVMMMRAAVHPRRLAKDTRSGLGTDRAPLCAKTQHPADLPGAARMTLVCTGTQKSNWSWVRNTHCPSLAKPSPVVAAVSDSQSAPELLKSPIGANA